MLPLRTVDRRHPIDRRHWANRGLLAHWMALPGWTGGGTWRDLAGRSDIALANFAAGHGWQAATRPGAAGQLDFNAATSGTAVGTVTSSALDNWATLTIAFWGRFTGYASFSRVMEKGANNEWTLAFNAGGQLGIQVGNTALVAGTNASAVDSLWHHYVFTLSAAPLGACWWDGVLQAGGGGGGTTPAAKTGTLTVGQYGGGANLGMVGQLDDVRIYGYQMTGQDPVRLYDLSRRMWPGVLNRGARPRAVGVAGAGPTFHAAWSRPNMMGA